MTLAADPSIAFAEELEESFLGEELEAGAIKSSFSSSVLAPLALEECQKSPKMHRCKERMAQGMMWVLKFYKAINLNLSKL